MLKIKIFLILFTMLLFASCTETEVQEITPLDNRIIGRWLLIDSSGLERLYSRTTRYGQFDYGYTFFDDESLVERSESGLCVGVNCITEDFVGVYKNLGNNNINVNVKNLKGKVSYDLQLRVIDINKIGILKK